MTRRWVGGVCAATPSLIWHPSEWQNCSALPSGLAERRGIGGRAAAVCTIRLSWAWSVARSGTQVAQVPRFAQDDNSYGTRVGVLRGTCVQATANPIN